MAKKAKKAKRGPGKPKKVITPAQMKKAEGYAFDGCQNGTIATLMGWDEEFLHGRKDILKKLHKKRCERKLFKRKEQDKHAKTQVSMSIFQGKNELGQMDKPGEDHNVNITVEIVKH